MLIEDKHECESCNKEFDWYYLVPQKWSNRIEAVVLPKGKTSVRKVEERVEKKGYFLPLRVSLYCPDCGSLNTFNVEEKEI
ncbi:hypothetical protein MKY29_03140 [Psychrobacillus sp. FSL K6-2365]|uniref:hypothetical protein n=1 Tax=Psychrobacillus sp. FSL K6-2365 TaxID=2921546 RepID=UPI0030FCAC11